MESAWSRVVGGEKDATRARADSDRDRREAGMTRAQNASLLRQAVLELQTIAFGLLDADLVGAGDAVARCGQELERMREEFVVFTRVPVEATR
jgi:hypothetical protein